MDLVERALALFDRMSSEQQDRFEVVSQGLAHARAVLAIRGILSGKQGEIAMSIKHYADSLEDAARFALAEAKAIDSCVIHRDFVFRCYDDDAERHAYAIATTILKRNGEMWMREDVMNAIKLELSFWETSVPNVPRND